MIITNLGSGSKGNATLIETDNLNILIDAGIPLSNIKKRLDRPFPKIDILLLTHTHSDHIKGIETFIKQYKPTIYTSENNIHEKIKAYENVKFDKIIELDTLYIETFKLSHDEPCIGIIIKENDKELIYITDTGYIKEKTLDKIKNKDMYILESNYDEEMLMNGPYPFYLQQRIRSPKGHLSNDDALKYLKYLIGDKTKYINLAHLSEENNKPEIVKENMEILKKEVPNKIKKITIYSQTDVNETVL